MRKTIENIILTSAALVALGAGLVSGACKRDYDITPTEPPAIHELAPNETTIEETIPPEIAEPYKLYAPTTTPEEFEKFNSALERSYEKVKDVYGVVPDITVLISPSKNKYDVLTRDVFKDLYGENANDIPDNRFPYPISHFDINDNNNLLVHEISHVVNESLFPTYHSWFDEGMVMYASGEIETPIKDGRFDRDAQKLRTNPKEYWQYWEGDVPGHIIGILYYGFLVRDYNMTPEQNRTTLSILQKRYLETGKELTKTDIQGTYESVLGVSLDPLFDLLKPGVMLLYSTDPAKAGTKGAEINKIIRSEFGIAN